jgi:hypothetical protein
VYRLLGCSEGLFLLIRFDKVDIEFFKEFLGAVDDSHRALVSKVLYGIFTRYVIPSIKVATSLTAS